MDGLTLLQPHTVFIEPLRPSGWTASGLYVLDHDETRDMGGKPSTMLVRVLEKHPSCDPEVKVGGVFVTRIYSWDTITHGDKDYHVMHEGNLHAEIEGYDAEAAA